MLRAVTLDAFGTIIDTGRDVLNRVCRAIVEENGRGVSPEAILERWDHYFFHRDDPEFLTLAELSEDSLASAFREYGILADARRYVEMLEAVWGTARVYPEVPGVLRALDGIPCAVVSNADDHLLKQIFARNGLDFPVTVTSESARTYKPRPRIFEIALEALRVDASDAVHVGDSLVAHRASACEPSG